MFRFSFICKTLLQNQYTTIHSKTSYVRYLQTIPSLKSVDKQSLTVSYLVNSCGLSLEKAISASKLVKIKSTERADSVLKLLTAYGFTKSNIATLVSKHPRVILSNPEKTLKPKIEYFQSVGILGPDLPMFLCSRTWIFLSSLKNLIIPTFDFLLGFVETNENLIKALRRCSRVTWYNTKEVMVPNIATLRAHGVPEPHIKMLMIIQPQSLTLRVDFFKEAVDEVKEMGFEPLSKSFILAIRSKSFISKVNWEKKKEVLMSFGWSEEEFNSAFRVQPLLMLCSEKKIRKLMDYFLKKLGLKPSNIVRCPNLFLCSLERRIIPRYSFLKVLMSKGLIKKEINLVWIFNMNKKEFEKKFVTEYKENVPEVIKAYQREMGFQGVGN